VYQVDPTRSLSASRAQIFFHERKPCAMFDLLFLV